MLGDDTPTCAKFLQIMHEVLEISDEFTSEGLGKTHDQIVSLDWLKINYKRKVFFDVVDVCFLCIRVVCAWRKSIL